MSNNVSQSARAKGIQKVHGTRVAAAYLRRIGFHFTLAHFILTGTWPKHA